MGSAISFSIANLFIGKVSKLGMRSVYYFNSGAVILFFGYFIWRKEWSRRNVGEIPEPGKEMHRKKVLTRKWGTNEIDWFVIFLVVCSAAY